MRRKSGKGDFLTNQNLLIDEPNDLQNKVGLHGNRTGNRKFSNKKHSISSATEVKICSPRLRTRLNTSNNVAVKEPSLEQTSDKKRKGREKKSIRKSTIVKDFASLPTDSKITNQSAAKSSEKQSKSMNSASFTSIAVEKMNLDIKIDPNVVDRYTDFGFSEEESNPESPETQQRRIDVIAHQCRLHPSNKKYNQGPVENPPPIKQGTMVGYTPGGQRFEVDLNFGRPKWFNSEYARMQWDYATKVNVTRMFHQLETGSFLPDTLDPSIERRYFAEQDMIKKQASEHYQKKFTNSKNIILDFSGVNVIGEDEEDLELLETEKKLLELNKFAAVRIQDFTSDIIQSLKKAIELPLTPLMLKKNPMILDAIEMLANQCKNKEVVFAARALLKKIEKLFNVPGNKSFRELFAEEVKDLKDKTRNMASFDIFTMTKEPPGEIDESTNQEAELSFKPTGEGQNETVILFEDRWVAVEGNDTWIDILPKSSGDGERADSSSGLGEAENAEMESQDDELATFISEE